MRTLIAAAAALCLLISANTGALAQRGPQVRLTDSGRYIPIIPIRHTTGRERWHSVWHRGLDLETITVAGHHITVARSFAGSISGFIRDVVARGFRGPIHCYARSGHVRRSLHYRGLACDFAQTGWNRTVHVMYHVGDLARKWGLRDGCTFRHPRRDCGHLDAGDERDRVAAR